MNKMSGRLRCCSIPYRQGFLEITNAHDGCVNIEAWHVAASVDLTSVTWVGDGLGEADVVGNTELELTPAEARQLARLLIEGAERAEGGPSG
jgi:hypothetical protein